MSVSGRKENKQEKHEDVRGFLLVDCPIVDFRSNRQATNTQSVSDISTVYISRVYQNFTRQIFIDNIENEIEWHCIDSGISDSDGVSFLFDRFFHHRDFAYL